MKLEVHAADIKAGDVFRDIDGSGWDAKSNAVIKKGEAHVTVQYVPDGGMGIRIWPRDVKVPVRRA